MDAVPVIEADSLRQAAADACRLLKVLSNPDRLLLLCEIMQQESCVSELEARTGIAQPTLSQQLGVLREEGCVATRRAGKNIYYRISHTQTIAIMEVLYQQFCGQQK